MKSELYTGLRDELQKIDAVDAHDHLPSEEEWLASEDDFTAFLGYAQSDLVNAGMRLDDLPEVLDERWKVDYGYPVSSTKTPEEKWDVIKKYWPYVKNIGSGAVTRTGLRLLFDCDDLTDQSIPKIQEKIGSYKKPGAYKKLLKDIANLHTSTNVVMDIDECPATEIFAPQLYTDTYSVIQSRRDIFRLEQKVNQEIYSLDTYVKAFDTLVKDAVDKGLVGLKWHIWPYLRGFDFDIANPFDAAKCFDRILKMPARGGAGSVVATGFDEMLPFQNYMQNHIVQLGIELDMPIQIHTGTLGLSFGGPLNNGDPSKLISLFLRYPQAKFNLLHTSYPYTRVLGAIAHVFPNVFINASWLETLSPQSYKSFMKDWLTGIPLNKIIAFGADQFNPFLVPAVAHRVRDLLAGALEELILEGSMTRDDAIFAAKRILRDNAVALWKLDAKKSH